MSNSPLIVLCIFMCLSKSMIEVQIYIGLYYVNSDRRLFKSIQVKEFLNSMDVTHDRFLSTDYE